MSLEQEIGLLDAQKRLNTSIELSIILELLNKLQDTPHQMSYAEKATLASFTGLSVDQGRAIATQMHLLYSKLLTCFPNASEVEIFENFRLFSQFFDLFCQNDKEKEEKVLAFFLEKIPIFNQEIAKQFINQFIKKYLETGEAVIGLTTFLADKNHLPAYRGIQQANTKEETSLVGTLMLSVRASYMSYLQPVICTTRIEKLKKPVEGITRYKLLFPNSLFPLARYKQVTANWLDPGLQGILELERVYEEGDELNEPKNWILKINLASIIRTIEKFENDYDVVIRGDQIICHPLRE